jgi:hypothetical protein
MGWIGYLLHNRDMISTHRSRDLDATPSIWYAAYIVGHVKGDRQHVITGLPSRQMRLWEESVA